MIEIDGSFGEGGGQILRTALSIAVRLNKDVLIRNIRKNRKSPGLKLQHLAGVKLLAEIADAEVDGAEIGSETVEFIPGKLKFSEIEYDIGSAGSITLLLQTLLLPSTINGGRFRIKGGTDVSWSPSIDYLRFVLLPLLGIDVKLNLERRGYYPKGDGVVGIEVDRSILKPIVIEERGELLKIRGIAHSSNLPEHIVHRMKAEAISMLKPLNCDVDIEEEIENFRSTGCGITLWLEFEDTRIGASSLGKIGKSAESVAREASEELLLAYDSGASLDRYAVDQLLPWAALAKGSRIRTSELSMHAKTCIYVLSIFGLDLDISMGIGTGAGAGAGAKIIRVL